MEDIIVQLGVVTIPAVVAYFGVRASNRAKRRVQQGPEWAQYAEGLREDAQVYRQQVVGLQQEVEALRSKYGSALSYVGVLQVYLPEGVEVPQPPKAIKGDLG